MILFMWSRVERVEEDDLVDAIQELGPEVLAQRLHHPAVRAFVDRAAICIGALGDVLAAEVRRHDHHRVLEIDRPSFAVGQPAVVEQLQEDVQHFGVRLLDLVEEHDGSTAAGGRPR